MAQKGKKSLRAKILPAKPRRKAKPVSAGARRSVPKTIVDPVSAELVERIEAYLRDQMPAARSIAISSLKRSASGNSRENWFFDAAWKENGKTVRRNLILRRDPPVPPFYSNREHEFLVMKGLKGFAPFPTPAVYWVELTGKWLERPFMIAERCPGVYDRYAIANESAPLARRLKFARYYAHTMGQLHALDWKAMGLAVLGAPRDAAEASAMQVDRWARDALSVAEPSPILAEALHWLARRRPRGDRISLVHGDFRPGNSLIEDDRVTVMLDWETAHLSDPMEDIGWYTMPSLYDWEHFIAGVYHHKEFYADYTAASEIPVDEEAVQYWRVLGALKTMAMTLTHATANLKAKQLGIAVTERVGGWNVFNEAMLARLMEL